ncbi:MAG: hypothetical protein U0X86_000069 [Wolbachia endosymbiont of Xenopsylla cheopis]
MIIDAALKFSEDRGVATVILLIGLLALGGALSYILSNEKNNVSSKGQLEECESNPHVHNNMSI